MITITIETDNAAFEDNREAEVARILADYARRLADGLANLPLTTQPLRDINGNTCGRVEVREPEPRRPSVYDLTDPAYTPRKGGRR
jgi:hypothetical protein